jgi:hypothetical protein
MDPIAEFRAGCDRLDTLLTTGRAAYAGREEPDPVVEIDLSSAYFVDAVYALRRKAGGHVAAALPGIVDLWYDTAYRRVRHFAESADNPLVEGTRAPLFLPRSREDIIDEIEVLDFASRPESDFIRMLELSFAKMALADTRKYAEWHRAQRQRYSDGRTIARYERELNRKDSQARLKRLGGAGLAIAAAGYLLYRRSQA